MAQPPRTRADDGFHPLRDFQNGPRIARPNLAQSFIPVAGPAWEAAADLQDGNYLGAAFNGGMMVADLLPVGVAAKGVRAGLKGVGVWRTGSLTAVAAQQAMRKKLGIVGRGIEIHHSIPLAGIKGTPIGKVGRDVKNWRNHYAFLKAMPLEQHRRLTGAFNGMPEFKAYQKLWYGTTDWQKALPTGVLAYAADVVENLKRRQQPTLPRSETKR